MYLDQDATGRIQIADLTTDQATAIQIALLAISENQIKDTQQSRFLRGLAIQLDEILSLTRNTNHPHDH